jgi:hypothetical protein
MNLKRFDAFFPLWHASFKSSLQGAELGRDSANGVKVMTNDIFIGLALGAIPGILVFYLLVRVQPRPPKAPVLGQPGDQLSADEHLVLDPDWWKHRYQSD